jgi:hypothetical protein
VPQAVRMAGAAVLATRSTTAPEVRTPWIVAPGTLPREHEHRRAARRFARSRRYVASSQRSPAHDYAKYALDGSAAQKHRCFRKSPSGPDAGPITLMGEGKWNSRSPVRGRYVTRVRQPLGRARPAGLRRAAEATDIPCVRNTRRGRRAGVRGRPVNTRMSGAAGGPPQPALLFTS